jgi:purine-binding chemotaxis protein CheW
MIELLVFELAGVRYALHLACVREVVRAVLITPLPEAPAVIEGVIDVRGSLVPVYDLRLRFGHAPRRLDAGDRIIIAWTGARTVAVRCERTEWLEAVAPDDVEQPGFMQGGRRISGVARLPDGVVLIHDLRLFLEDAENAALEGALAAHATRDAG